MCVCVRWGKNVSKERTDKAMLGVAYSEYEMMNDMPDMMINMYDIIINMCVMMINMCDIMTR